MRTMGSYGKATRDDQLVARKTASDKSAAAVIVAEESSWQGVKVAAAVEGTYRKDQRPRATVEVRSKGWVGGREVKEGKKDTKGADDDMKPQTSPGTEQDEDPRKVERAYAERRMKDGVQVVEIEAG